LGNARIIPQRDVSESILRQLSDAPRFFLEIEDETDVRDTLDRALVVFKLFKNDPLLANIAFVDTLRIEFQEYLYYTGPARPHVPEYHLTLDEEKRLDPFWREHISINSKNFAVYQFHLADFGPYLRPSFVNYVESLEYLLVPDSEGGEIAYKFRSRGALILGQDKQPAERKMIYARLKESYSLRSAIVHGASEEKHRKRFCELAGIADEWSDALLSVIRCDARRALCYFFRERCLDDRKLRGKLLQERLIFHAQT
jgi:hypothetical protein